MYGKTIINIEKPTTQAVESVKALLAWKGHPINPLPADVSLENGRLVLVLSNKKDAYYTCTAKACSCPAAFYHHGPCKHQRKFFPEVKAATRPTDSILPKREPFRPFIEDEARPAKAAAKPLSVIDCHDTTALDVAYHSIKADREMWPMCEA
jgi:hypothetical protein